MGPDETQLESGEGGEHRGDRCASCHATHGLTALAIHRVGIERLAMSLMIFMHAVVAGRARYRVFQASVMARSSIIAAAVHEGTGTRRHRYRSDKHINED